MNRLLSVFALWICTLHLSDVFAQQPTTCEKVSAWVKMTPESLVDEWIRTAEIHMLVSSVANGSDGKFTFSDFEIPDAEWLDYGFGSYGQHLYQKMIQENPNSTIKGIEFLTSYKQSLLKLMEPYKNEQGFLTRKSFKLGTGLGKLIQETWKSRQSSVDFKRGFEVAFPRGKLKHEQFFDYYIRYKANKNAMAFFEQKEFTSFIYSLLKRNQKIGEFPSELVKSKLEKIDLRDPKTKHFSKAFYNSKFNPQPDEYLLAYGDQWTLLTVSRRSSYMDPLVFRYITLSPYTGRLTVESVELKPEINEINTNTLEDWEKELFTVKANDPFSRVERFKSVNPRLGIQVPHVLMGFLPLFEELGYDFKKPDIQKYIWKETLRASQFAGEAFGQLVGKTKLSLKVLALGQKRKNADHIIFRPLVRQNKLTREALDQSKQWIKAYSWGENLTAYFDVSKLENGIMSGFLYDGHRDLIIPVSWDGENPKASMPIQSQDYNTQYRFMWRLFCDLIIR